APGGIATPQVYSQLLSLYLLHNDMNNARYLWKRIPQAIKLANPELSAMWGVGQRIWQRDFPGVYTAITAFQWSENVLPVMDSLREGTRQRAYGLVAQAYTSIAAQDLAAFVGYSVEEAVKGVVSQGWQADPSTRMVMPQKPGIFLSYLLLLGLTPSKFSLSGWGATAGVLIGRLKLYCEQCDGGAGQMFQMAQPSSSMGSSSAPEAVACVSSATSATSVK
ncbi:hypothetical protein NHX12_007020, partial [Muraenolepis orangiensis]